MEISKPLSKEESKNGDVIPEGVYSFTVADAAEAVSKAGNDMIKVKLKLFMPDGSERIKIDYVMEAMKYKMAHFFDCLGLWDDYQSGAVDADDCIGKSGQVKIIVKDGQSDVKDYILDDTQQAAKQERKASEAKKTAKADGFNDDVPF